MTRSIHHALITAMAVVAGSSLIAAGSASAQSGEAAAAQTATLQVTATGQVTADPDQATVVIGVEGAGRDADAAMADNSATMRAITDALAELDISGADLQTTQISLAPRYADRESADPEIVGYRVSNQLRATVSRIDALGQALDAAVGAGANRIRSVSFGISDTRDLEAEARRHAGTIALAKARDYAAGLGTEVIGIKEISETRQRQPGPRMARQSVSRDTSVPVASGSATVSVSISAVFTIGGSLE